MKIVVKVRGGLGNRMRVIASCLALHKRLRETIDVLWINDGELNCPFERLFLPLEGVNIINIPYIQKWNKIKRRRVFAKLSSDYQDFDIQFSDTEIVELKRMKTDIVKLIKDAESVFIETCHHFYGDESFLAYLLPCKSISNMVKKRKSELGLTSYIGIHIRRTDNKISKEQSTTQGFIQYIEYCENQSIDNQYYLSTDDKEEAVQLKKVFGDKINYVSSSVRRNKPASIEAALVDMLMLSKSRKVIGSYWSSFSEVAAAYNGVTLDIVRESDK